MRQRDRGGIFFSLLFLCALICFAGLLYIVRQPLLREIAALWIVDEPAAHADAMIILSDDNYQGDRAAHAADLYKQGVAPVIVASNHLLRPFAEVGDLMTHDLQNHGVPASAIVKSPPHRAANTREEAAVLRSFVVSRGWKRIVVVTSNYHTRRSRFIFGKVFPSDINVSMAAAPDAEFDPSMWWQTRSGLKMCLYEAVGYIVARWELRNTASAPSGVSTLLFVGWSAE